MDVPEPDDAEVATFAAVTALDGGARDDNAQRWAVTSEDAPHAIDGAWQSRWNGGADPTMPGDTPEMWKAGRAEVRSLGTRVYIRFDWHEGTRRGLIEAQRRDGNRLVGKYINLTNPAIMRPWVGLIVANDRIDGQWTNGRLDFRR
jgi:hypothetical protein